ncbi:hypothetical protein [Idiomarina sp.]|uniref:hypothetical protein n=1 Tax=Idiomarina sp. TaxID=1874361 RepID=UPI002638706C|nr:hypothetical protein [Idiomarina sp.]
MEKPKLYLHVGSHKTGTSAIQQFCFKNKGTLREQGFFYPTYEPLSNKFKGGHHSIAHAIADDSRLLNVDEATSLVTLWRHFCLRNGCALFVSAEAMYRQTLGEGKHSERREKYLERLAELFNGFDITVLIVFRRPDDYVRSWYQERVKSSLKKLPDFQAFRNSGLASGVNYSQAAKLFLSNFRDVRGFIYEDLVSSSGNVVAGFLEQLGINVDGMERVKTVRKSLSVPQTVVKAYANEFIVNREHSKKFSKWLKSEKGEDLLNQYFAPEQHYSLWESGEARRNFIESRSDDLSKLSTLLFNGRKVLFRDLKLSNKDDVFIGKLPDELKETINKIIDDKRPSSPR